MYAAVDVSIKWPEFFVPRVPPNDPYGTIAWSAVVKGRPEAVPEDDLDQEAVDQKVSPWEPGAKDYLFRLTPTEISGRRFVINMPRRWWSPQEP